MGASCSGGDRPCTWRSNTGGRSAKLTGCQRWQRNSRAAQWPSSLRGRQNRLPPLAARSGFGRNDLTLPGVLSHLRGYGTTRPLSNGAFQNGTSIRDCAVTVPASGS
jgi:hypothetical protein